MTRRQISQKSGVIVRFLGQVLGHMHQLDIGLWEQLLHPVVAQGAINRFALKRADQHIQPITIPASEVNQVLVPAVRGHKLAEDHANAAYESMTQQWRPEYAFATARGQRLFHALAHDGRDFAQPHRLQLLDHLLCLGLRRRIETTEGGARETHPAK